MLSVVKPVETITLQDYLASEPHSEVKREYCDGQLFAMVGSSKNHDTLASTLLRKFGNHLENSPCRPYGSDVRIKTAANCFRYTDGMVVCDDSGDSFYTESPILIVEVLSKSTRHIDKGKKLLEYINIKSMQEYVMIEQDFVSIDVLRKSEGWILRNYSLGDTIHFGSIDLHLTVEEIYHRVDNEEMLAFLANQR